MGAYQQFVKAHYHDKQFAGMTPPQTIKAVATLWRSHKKGGSVTGGTVTGGNAMEDLFHGLGGAVHAKKGKAAKRVRAKKGGAVAGGGFFGDILENVF